MQTECSANDIDFGRAGSRRVVADFDGGTVSSDAGALLLGETDKAIGLVERFSACFWDLRDPIYVVHEIKALIAQRVFGLALGYEDSALKCQCANRQAPRSPNARMRLEDAGACLPAFHASSVGRHCP
jgi:Transposase DDE domain group 1